LALKFWLVNSLWPSDMYFVPSTWPPTILASEMTSCVFIPILFTVLPFYTSFVHSNGEVLLVFLFEQGGNDHEIYESERTVGHTGEIYI
jgi:hypothetical protein